MSTSSSDKLAERIMVDTSKSFKMPDLSGGFKTIEVKNKTIHVHTNVLTKSSQSISDTKEREERMDPTKPLCLTKFEVAIVEDYVQWLYTGKIITLLAIQHQPKHLARLYQLGENLNDAVFKGAIMDVFKSIVTVSIPSEECFRIIYAASSPDAPARQLLVDLWRTHATADWMTSKDLLATTCAEFVNDLAIAFTKTKRAAANTKTSPSASKKRAPSSCTVHDDSEEDIKALVGLKKRKVGI